MPFFQLPVLASNPWCPLHCRHITPISASLFTLPSSLCLLYLSLIRILVNGFRATPSGKKNLISRSITKLQWQKFLLQTCILLLLSRSVTFDSLQPHGLQSARLLCPQDFPGKNIAVGCLFLLQEIFLTQGLNSCLLHQSVLTDSLPIVPLYSIQYRECLRFFFEK